MLPLDILKESTHADACVEILKEFGRVCMYIYIHVCLYVCAYVCKYVCVDQHSGRTLVFQSKLHVQWGEGRRKGEWRRGGDKMEGKREAGTREKGGAWGERRQNIERKGAGRERRGKGRVERNGTG